MNDRLLIETINNLTWVLLVIGVFVGLADLGLIYLATRERTPPVTREQIERHNW